MAAKDYDPDRCLLDENFTNMPPPACTGSVQRRVVCSGKCARRPGVPCVSFARTRCLCTRCVVWSALRVAPCAQERQRERAAVDAERTANYKRAMTFLIEQHRDLKSGGQKGMNPHKKKT